jgi:hypothetical protein
MRRTFLLTVVLSALLILAGGTVAADGALVVVDPPSFMLMGFNPCTGSPIEVTLTPTLTVHEFNVQNPGRHHFNTQFRISLVTSDGFSGTGVGPDIDNGSGLFGDPEAEGQGTFTAMFNVILENDEGQKFSVHENFHIAIVDGNLTSSVDNISFTCLGNDG